MTLWWIAGALVVLPSLLVALAAAQVAGRQRELRHQAARAQQVNTDRLARLANGQARLQPGLVSLRGGAEQASRRAARLRRHLAELAPNAGR